MKIKLGNIPPINLCPQKNLTSTMANLSECGAAAATQGSPRGGYIISSLLGVRKFLEMHAVRELRAHTAQAAPVHSIGNKE